MKKRIEDFTVVSNIRINPRHYVLKLKAPKPLPEMFPGQFAEVLVTQAKSAFLRRPLSIHNVDYKQNTINFLVQIVGEGTLGLGSIKEGDQLNIMYPLGNSYKLPLDKKDILLAGGGCGVAPLLFLARYLYENGFNPTTLIGGKTEEDLLEPDEYKKFGKVLLISEDGAADEKGMLTDHSIFNSSQPLFSKIFTCGPEPMMKALARYARSHDIECEVSLENTMACGIGACLCCVVETTTGNRCACTEGPVFNINELTW
ncbi:dihydroorotate dehydrogenase electron transfer subunit [Bacteroidota bacterium]